jgi:hypothetical protein
VPGAWCLVPGAWCLVPGAWCLVPGAWCLVPGAWPWPWLVAVSIVAGFSTIETQSEKNQGRRESVSHAKSVLRNLALRLQ